MAASRFFNYRLVPPSPPRKKSLRSKVRKIRFSICSVQYATWRRGTGPGRGRGGEHGAYLEQFGRKKPPSSKTTPGKSPEDSLSGAASVPYQIWTIYVTKNGTCMEPLMIHIWDHL